MQAGTPPDFTIQSIKIGNPNDMTKCPRDPSAQGPWQEYGWQITAVFIWLLVVVGGAFAVRGVTKYRRRKEYLTLNDDLRSEQAQRVSKHFSIPFIFFRILLSVILLSSFLFLLPPVFFLSSPSLFFFPPPLLSSGNMELLMRCYVGASFHKVSSRGCTLPFN